MNAKSEVPLTNAPTQIGAPTSLHLWQQVALFLVSCAVVVARLPDRLFHPQLYGEDGAVWLPDAWKFGWFHALAHPWNGIIQTFPRIGAAFALLVPLAQAPLVLSLFAIAAQALPVTVLLSSRSAAWGSLRFRFLMAGLYLALPNSTELSFGITESQWHLALAAFLLLVASVPRTAAGRTLDLAFLFLSGLSGPFCFFLFPIAAFVALRRKDTGRWLPPAVFGICCTLQMVSLLVLDRTGRPHHPIGATFDLFVRIVGGRIVLSALVGATGLPTAPGKGLFVVLVCLTVLGIAIVAACFIQSAVEMRLFIIFSSLVFAASLGSITTGQPSQVSVWRILVEFSDLRYWFLPSLAFVWALLACARNRQLLLKSISVLLLVVMSIGILRDWKQPSLRTLHFPEQVEQLKLRRLEQQSGTPKNLQDPPLSVIKR